MGATCGNRHNLIIQFQDKSLDKPGGCSSFSQLRDWVCRQLPQLYITAFDFYFFNTLLRSEHDYSLAIRKAKNELVLVAKPQPPPRLSSKLWTLVSKAVVKLRMINREVEGTAVLLSPRHLISTAELLRDKSCVKEYSVLTFDNKEFTLKNTFVRVGDNLVLVEIDGHATSGVKLQSTFNAKIGDNATVLYYTKKRPVIHEFSDIINGKDDHQFRLLDTNLREGSSGAPIFNSAGEIIGIYSPYSESCVQIDYIANHILNLSLNDANTSEVVREIANYSGLFMEDLLENQADMSMESAEVSSWNGPCLANNNTLKFHSGERKNKYKMNLEHGTASFAISIGSGILLTGKDSQDNWNMAWMFDGKTAKTLPNMMYQHKHHCAVVFNNKTFIISGKKTNGIDVWNNRWWEEFEPLPSVTAYSSATVYKQSLLVCGGVSENGYTNKIYRYENTQWEILTLKLPNKLASHCVACTQHDRLLVLGGFTKTDTNYSGWILDSDGNILEDIQIDDTVTFDGRPFVKQQNRFLAFTCTGKLVQYHRGSVHIG